MQWTRKSGSDGSSDTSYDGMNHSNSETCLSTLVCLHKPAHRSTSMHRCRLTFSHADARLHAHLPHSCTCLPQGLPLPQPCLYLSCHAWAPREPLHWGTSLGEHILALSEWVGQARDRRWICACPWYSPTFLGAGGQTPTYGPLPLLCPHWRGQVGLLSLL